MKHVRAHILIEAIIRTGAFHGKSIFFNYEIKSKFKQMLNRFFNIFQKKQQEYPFHKDLFQSQSQIMMTP